jgi:UPF0176 protein
MNASTIIAALYKFTPLDDLETLRGRLLDLCRGEVLGGTLIIAREGMNGTVAGSRGGIDALLAFLRSLPGCADLEHKESFADEMPFYRMKVRIKKEIVTMGVPDTDPTAIVGAYVEQQDWNALISEPDVAVIDTRNDYEVGIGTFEGAINPGTDSFREFPEWFREQKELHGKKKFAMFCTGGIRCEKATAFLRGLGFDEVYHLKGGILKYLERMPEEESLWRGECFVFDQRTAVRHGLDIGSYELCYACRMPIDAEDKVSGYYQPGVSCPKCHDRQTDEQKKRFADRHKQVALARKRGEQHVGARQEKKKSALPAADQEPI